MKETELWELLVSLSANEISLEEAHDRILRLERIGVRDSFISVGEQEPPHNTELLAKSPTGTVHICSWRPVYNIFTCQDKSESSWNWSWKLI